MGKLKSLRQPRAKPKVRQERARWASHGSTVWIWEPREADSAVDYVVRRQGKPMAVYETPNRWEAFLSWPEKTERRV